MSSGTSISHDDSNDADMHNEFNSSLMPPLDSLMTGELDEILNTIGQPVVVDDSEMGSLQLESLPNVSFTDDPSFANGTIDMIKQEPLDDDIDTCDSSGLSGANHHHIDFSNSLSGNHQTVILNRPLSSSLRYGHSVTSKARPHAPHCPLHACGCGQRPTQHSHSNTRMMAAHAHVHRPMRNVESHQPMAYRTILRIPTSPSTLSSLVHSNTVLVNGSLAHQRNAARSSLLSIAHPHAVPASELTPTTSSSSSLHSIAPSGLVLTVPAVSGATTRKHSGPSGGESRQEQQLETETETPRRHVTLRRNGESDTSLFTRGLLATTLNPIDAQQSALNSAASSSSSAFAKTNSNACLVFSIATPIVSSTEDLTSSMNAGAMIGGPKDTNQLSLPDVSANGSGNTSCENVSRCSPTPTIDTESNAPTVNGSGRRRKMDKLSDEYRLRRERNNVAVRKSREKAKARNEDTNRRVKDLASENDQLLRKLESVLQELTLLKSLFQKLGAPIPDCVLQAPFNTSLSAKAFAAARSLAGLNSNSNPNSKTMSNSDQADVKDDAAASFSALCEAITQHNDSPAASASSPDGNEHEASQMSESSGLPIVTTGADCKPEIQAAPDDG